MFSSLRYRRKYHYRSFRFASITLSFAFDVSEHVYTVHVQIVSAQIVSGTNCIGTICIGTICIGHKLYRAQTVSGTNCIGHKLYRAQIVSYSKIKRSGSYFENTNMKPRQKEETGHNILCKCCYTLDSWTAELLASNFLFSWSFSAVVTFVVGCRNRCFFSW